LPGKTLLILILRVIRNNEQDINLAHCSKNSLRQALDLQAPARGSTDLLARFQTEHREMQWTGNAFTLFIDRPMDQPAIAVWTGMRHLILLIVDNDGERARTPKFR
jgi:hypothetical protein